MDDILYFVLFVFGVLQIILFFKLWGMTNNVENLNKIASASDKSDFEAAQIETLLGNYEKAYNIYKRCFILETIKLFKESNTTSYFDIFYEKLIQKYQKCIDTLEGEYSIDFDKYNSLEKIKNLISKD